MLSGFNYTGDGTKILSEEEHSENYKTNIQ